MNVLFSQSQEEKKHQYDKCFVGVLVLFQSSEACAIILDRKRCKELRNVGMMEKQKLAAWGQCAGLVHTLQGCAWCRPQRAGSRSHNSVHIHQ